MHHRRDQLDLIGAETLGRNQIVCGEQRRNGVLGTLHIALRESGDFGIRDLLLDHPPDEWLLGQEFEERVEARLQKRLAFAVLGGLDGLEGALERIGGALAADVRVKLALSLEVLVDQRLGDVGLLGDLLDPGTFVAATGEDLGGGVKDAALALGPAQTAAMGAIFGNGRPFARPARCRCWLSPLHQRAGCSLARAGCRGESGRGRAT